MTLKQLVDEALDNKAMQDQINQMVTGVTQFTNKLNSNPDLQKQFGQDAQNLNNLASGVSKSFQDLVKQQLILQQQKAIQPNNTTTAPTTASGQPANGQVAASGQATATPTANR